VVEDYIHFMLIMSEVCPNDLLLSSAFTGGFQVSVSSLSMIQPEIIFPALEFIRSTVGHNCMRPSMQSQLTLDERRFEPMIRQTVSSAGFQLVGIVLTGLVSHFPDDGVFLVVDIMSSLALAWSTELSQWLPPVIEQLPLSSVPPAAKTQFLSDFAK
jgi:transportin-3